MNPTDSRELFTGTDTEREAARQIAEAEQLSAVLRSARPSIDRATGNLERESPLFYGILARNNKPAAIFVAVKGAIYKGSLRVGTVTSSTLAKRIVRLLNRYPANEKGV